MSVSVFASRVKKQVALGEGDQVVVVTIRRLSGKSQEKAAEARQIAQIAKARSAGADLVKLFRELENVKSELPTEPVARAKARYDLYDRDTVLTAGIEDITPRPLKKDGKTHMSLAESIDDFDDEARETVHRAIIDFSPSFHETAEDAEAAGKDA